VEEFAHAAPREPAEPEEKADWLSLDSSYWAVPEPTLTAEPDDSAPAVEAPQQAPVTVKRVVMGRVRLLS